MKFLPSWQSTDTQYAHSYHRYPIHKVQSLLILPTSQVLFTSIHNHKKLYKFHSKVIDGEVPPKPQHVHAQTHT